MDVSRLSKDYYGAGRSYREPSWSDGRAIESGNEIAMIEMCRVVDTVLIDQETIYAPRHGNDRLLLGLKGSLNEYELDLLRQRLL